MSEAHPGVTVCIPSIPIRAGMLERAVASVKRQTYQPLGLEIEIDHDRTGAAATRTRALDRVTTEFVAFLDDDDELFPRHVELLVREQRRTKADVVYPWFEVIGGDDPFQGRYKARFNKKLLRETQYVPITLLARTELVRAAGCFVAQPNERGWSQEDWTCWNSMLDKGAKFVHLPKITWSWNHHGRNTSGNPTKW